jgi:hypothetical protein
MTDNVKYSLMAKVLGKVKGRRAMVHMFTAKGFGEIRK